MKKVVFILGAVALFAGSCNQATEKQKTDNTIVSTAEQTIDVLSWLQMPPNEFGCMMEKTFGHRDERFNCSLKKYENRGDPCVNYEAYYEGPEFPENLVKKVHPWIKTIHLSWENGMLQSVMFAFDHNPTEKEIYTEFGINPNRLPSNVNGIDAGNGILRIDGFEHAGAGEVDCDEYIKYMQESSVRAE